MSDGSPSSLESRVVPLRRRTAGTQAPNAPQQSPIADLSRFEAGEEPDDYRHRMLVNMAALLFLAALIGGGIWLVNQMARMHKDQECVLSGRRGCTPVEYTPNR